MRITATINMSDSNRFDLITIAAIGGINTAIGRCAVE
jgi:hypothetical protein